jgi:hypothetical protein
MIKVNQVQVFVFQATTASNFSGVRLKSGDGINLYFEMSSQESFNLASKLLKQLSRNSRMTEKVQKLLEEINEDYNLSTLEMLRL